MPAALVAAALAGCPEGDPGDDSTEPQPESTASETATDTDATAACVEITQQPPCDAAPTCAWDGVCHVHCPKLLDQAACMEQLDLCYWVDGACDYGAI